MRFPEDKIKQAILRPERDVALRALQYFTESYSQDPTIMPLVIQAVEMHGREHAAELIASTGSLSQTTDTVAPQWPRR